MSTEPPRELPDRLRELVDGATVAERRLCDVDEAALLVVGWLPTPGRGPVGFAGGASPHDFPGSEPARQRLLDAGLAVRGASDTPAEMTSVGALRDYLDLVVGYRLQTSQWVSYPHDAPGPAARLARRITPLRDTGVAVMERMAVPPAADPNEPLGIEISLMPISAVADEISGLAYRDPGSAAERSTASATESVLVGPDRKNPAFPSVLVHRWDEATAVLQWRSLSLFGRRYPGERVGRTKLVQPLVKPPQYRDHVLLRLRCPEPALR